MKIIIQTKTGEALKNIIFKYVDDQNLNTWVVRKDAKGIIFLTHKREQWYDRALIGFAI
ncbi:hypothetical protein [Lunatibacter salilacus]|uniref:hypothetical protein n=1 Tax=Lunatibacter salilacus TaxID=2483804 RepID=UPI00131E49B8|nr:hypothetical protein [Lunatibacter salilacus]